MNKNNILPKDIPIDINYLENSLKEILKKSYVNIQLLSKVNTENVRNPDPEYSYYFFEEREELAKIRGVVIRYRNVDALMIQQRMIDNYVQDPVMYAIDEKDDVEIIQPSILDIVEIKLPKFF